MKKLLLLFTTALSFTGLSADTPVNSSLTWNGESSLAIDPNNPQKLVVAWMRVYAVSPARIAIFTSYSSDAGQTWSSPNQLPGHFDPAYNTAADPTVVIGNNGVIYVGWVDYRTTLDSGAVYVAKSTDGGMTFDSGTKVIDWGDSPDIPIDRPWLAIDNSNSAYAGRLYCVTKSYVDSPPPHHIWLMCSGDGAATWTAPLWVDDSLQTGLLQNIMGVPAVGADGKLYIGYASWDTSATFYARIVYARSVDGGATLTYHEQAVVNPGSGLNPADTFYQGSYHLAANPVNPQQLIAVSVDNRNGDPDIYMTRTADGGTTWTTPARLNDDALSNGKGQDMCWAGFSPGGTYAAVWRDRRNATVTGDNADFMIYAAASTDGGATFIPNFPVSTGTSPVIQVVRGNDFIGVGVTDSCVIATWADLRTGPFPQIYTNRVCPAPLGVSQETEAPARNIYFDAAARTIVVDAEQGMPVEVLNALGQPVFTGKITDKPMIISAGNFPPGVYLVRAGGKNVKAEKIVIR